MTVAEPNSPPAHIAGFSPMGKRGRNRRWRCRRSNSRRRVERHASATVAAQRHSGVTFGGCVTGQFLPAANFVTIERKSSVWKD